MGSDNKHKKHTIKKKRKADDCSSSYESSDISDNSEADLSVSCCTIIVFGLIFKFYSVTFLPHLSAGNCQVPVTAGAESTSAKSIAKRRTSEDQKTRS
jgi:hypothetical protein